VGAVHWEDTGCPRPIWVWVGLGISSANLGKQGCTLTTEVQVFRIFVIWLPKGIVIDAREEVRCNLQFVMEV
jgi:hypothetical protein